MDDIQDIRELQKLPEGTGPKKKTCVPCRIVLIATIILFGLSLILVMFRLYHARTEPEAGNMPMVPTREQSAERTKSLREFIKTEQGSTTLIVGRSQAR